MYVDGGAEGGKAGSVWRVGGGEYRNETTKIGGAQLPTTYLGNCDPYSHSITLNKSPSRPQVSLQHSSS